MTTDFEAIGLFPQIIGIVDHPAGKPEQFAFDGRQIAER